MKSGVENVQTPGYNGSRMVICKNWHSKKDDSKLCSSLVIVSMCSTDDLVQQGQQSLKFAQTTKWRGNFMNFQHFYEC